MIDSSNASTLVQAYGQKGAANAAIGQAVGGAARQVGGAITDMRERMALDKIKGVVKQLGGNPDAVADLDSAKAELLRLHSQGQAGEIQKAMAPPDDAGASGNIDYTSFGTPETPADAAPTDSTQPSGGGILGIGSLPTPDLGQAAGAAGADAAQGPAAVAGAFSTPDAPAAQAGPPGSPTAAPQPQPKIGMAGVDTTGEQGSGPAPTAAPQYPPTGAIPTNPLQPKPAVDPRRAYFDRLRKAQGLDMTGLSAGVNLAHSMFGAPTDPTEQRLREAEIKRNEAEAARDPAAAYKSEREYDRTHGVGEFAAKPVTPRNIDPNSPEGIAAAKARKKAELEAESESGAPKPYKPMTRDEEMKDAEDRAAASARGTNAGGGNPQANSLKDIQLKLEQLRLDEHVSPEAKAAEDTLKDLTERSRDVKRSAMYPGGPDALKADIATAQAAVSAAKAPPAKTAGPGAAPASAPPGDPTKVKALQANGWTWDGTQWKEPAAK